MWTWPPSRPNARGRVSGRRRRCAVSTPRPDPCTTDASVGRSDSRRNCGLQTQVTEVFALSDLIFDPAKLDGKQGMGNIGVPYEDPDIDADIERVATQPGGENRHKKNFTPKGKVGSVKIVSTHTSGDGLVIVEQEQPYQDSVPASNLTVAVANESGNTHCGFSGAELASGWESLRTWVATDAQPSVAAIQGTCLAIEGIFGGPCRYDPSFVIPNMDIRVPPR